MKPTTHEWSRIGFFVCLIALAVAYFAIATTPVSAQDVEQEAAVEAPIALGFNEGPPPARGERFRGEGQPRPGREFMRELRERKPELFEEARERIENGEHPREVIPQLVREYRENASEEDKEWMRGKREQFRGANQERVRQFREDGPRGPRRMAMADRGPGQQRRGPVARGDERGPRAGKGEMRGRGPQGFECPHCHKAIERPARGPRGPRFDDDAPRGPRGPRFDDDAPRGPRGPRFGGGDDFGESIERLKEQIERLEDQLEDSRARE